MKPCSLKIYLLTALALLTNAVYAIPFSYNGPSGLNVDTNPATEISFTITDTGIINDLNLSVFLLSDFPEDLDISLSHHGVSTTLFDGGGLPHATQFDVVFDDEAASVIDPFNGRSDNFKGTYRGMNPLSVFDGLNLGGDWTLTILDEFFFPNEGDTLLAWQISGDFTPDSVEPVSEPGIFGILLLSGLSLLWRYSSGRKSNH